jgi:hypothetical protein
MDTLTLVMAMSLNYFDSNQLENIQPFFDTILRAILVR